MAMAKHGTAQALRRDVWLSTGIAQRGTAEALRSMAEYRKGIA